MTPAAENSVGAKGERDLPAVMSGLRRDTVKASKPCLKWI